MAAVSYPSAGQPGMREDQMRLGTIALWALIAATAGAAAPGHALQDQAHPRPPSARPISPTLVVRCDLACDWKLDGEPKGQIKAGAYARVRVEPGQHAVEAVTEDGADQVDLTSDVAEKGQTEVVVKLQPVRDDRLAAEQAAKDKADQEARDRAAAEQAAKDKADLEAREAAAQEKDARDKAAQQEAARLQELRDNAGSRFNQGQRLYNEKSYDEAKPLLEKACEGGSMYGCTSLGKLYQNGLGVTQDYAQALTLYQKACDGGNMGACYSLGSLYQNGWGVTQDYAQAGTLYQKACDDGNLGGCYALGALYEVGRGETQDYVQAGTLFKKACGGGNLQACADLAALYQNGQGVTQDSSQARTLYQKACDGGLQPSCAAAATLSKQVQPPVQPPEQTPQVTGQTAPTDAASSPDLREQAAKSFNEGNALYGQQRYDEAKPLLEKACDGGEMPACTGLAVLYQNGQGVAQDFDQARRLYQKACDGGLQSSCAIAAMLSKQQPEKASQPGGPSAPGDVAISQDLRDHAASRAAEGQALYDQKRYDDARQDLQQACDGGSMLGCSTLGILYQTGRGVPQNVAQARTLFRRACNGGELLGCQNILLLNGEGTIGVQDLRKRAPEKNRKGDELFGQNHYAEAMPLYEQACEGESMAACGNVAYLYENGMGVTKDVGMANAYYLKQCDGGDIHGCSILGDHYMNGKGVIRDYAQASTLLRKACDSGETDACGSLGKLYRDGNGVTKDSTEAHALFQKSCTGQKMDACVDLGKTYLNGEGVLKDDVEARTLYQKACNGEYLDGCANLAELYLHGIGGSKDKNQARTLYKKACDGGDQDACAGLRNMP